MLQRLFGGAAGAATLPTAPAPAAAPAPGTPAATVLVIQSDAYDWAGVFAGAVLRDGRAVRVVQTGWRHLLVQADNTSRDRRKRCVCTVQRTTAHRGGAASQECGGLLKGQTVFPDFVLIRNEVFTPSEDHRNKLYGLMYAGVPSLNSLMSIYQFCERPIVQGELNRLHDQHGDAFPVIEQNYFASAREFMYSLPFPAVVKVGAAHAGAGKMRIRDHHDMEDFRSVLQMTEGKYCLAEPFLEGESDLRVQNIGGEVRAFRRRTVSGNWKTNTGCSACEEIEVTPTYRRWAELAQGILGGLDILTVDAVCTTDGREIILEVNGTSSGLFPETEERDNARIRDMVIARMNAACTRSGPGGEAEASEAEEAR